MNQKKEEKEVRLNKKMLERIIIVHNAIKAGLYPNVPKLQRLYCEQTGYDKVGEATMYRTIETLQTYFHAPLEFDRAKGGYYYSDDNWEFALNKISADDAFYLSAAKTLLSGFEGSPVYKAISDVINFVIDTQGAAKSSILERIAVPPKPKAVIDEEVWKNLLKAVQNNLIAEFDYKGRWNTEETHRSLRPYQFLFDEGRCFIFGYDELRGEERIFSLSRIKNLTVTEKHFELPGDFDFSLRCGGGKFGAFTSGDKVCFVIDFYGDARGLVKECVWADDQRLTDFDGEDKTRMEFTSSQTLKVMEWILSQGENAVPLAPDWFVSDWKEHVQKMGERARD